MPFGMDSSSRERVEANNKIRIPDGTRPGTIADIFLYNVVEVEENGRTKRKYTQQPSEQQDCEVKVKFDSRPDIVLRKTFRVYIGPKSAFAKFIKAMLGVEPGEPLIKFLLPEGGGEALTADQAKAISKKLRNALANWPVLITTECKEGSEYTNVAAIGAAPVAEGGDDLAAVPMQRNPGLQKEPLTPAQQASEAHDDGPSWDDLSDEVPF